MLKDGFTLMHEHLSISLSDHDLGTDLFEILCEELEAVKKYGVENIVDQTNACMGRSVAYTTQIAMKTGINILFSTGYYLEKYMPSYIYTLPVEEISKIAIDELTLGISDTGIKASVIGEIATGIRRVLPGQRIAFEALSRAAVITGAPFVTHTSYGTMGKWQAKYLLNKGISPNRILISHMDLCNNPLEVLSVLKSGVNIGIDTIGKQGVSDNKRAHLLKFLIKKGFEKQIILSMDICRKDQLKSRGGYGYTYLFEKFIPMCLRLGVEEKKINQILYDNPKRILL